MTTTDSALDAQAMSSSPTDTLKLPDYAPIPKASLGPALNSQVTTSAVSNGISTGLPTACTSRRS
jgi:hypothetical protein